ncbi:methyltransferase domain-containing protein [Bacillus sp. FJAT-49732]|uniref:Methyltransferase domain-containing protein n=1 Tax=Lederbergia citrisecunda TaxID=2833583 RepID=A0A942YQF7_9BACI|nr:methyltransferase domain-containing protein [Lederbergia citrisecunda]MBS4202236.1 methyltransferase domain-containing protein [Lederbergia citrisecunda]
MIFDNQFEQLIESSNRPFSGWDFSYVNGTGRIVSEPLSWSYGSKALGLIKNSSSMLDMGTGGGEFLSMLRPFPPIIYATEAYKPNVPIAKNRLESLGVKVFEIEDDHQLPFDNSFFDLIINKHEAYSNQEVRRIITDNGLFLTQQVGGLDCHDINDALGLPYNEEFIDWNLAKAASDLEDNGFKILESREEFPIQRFFDIGALVYYLKAIPWQAPEFNVEKEKQKLYEIHQLIQDKGYFDVKQHRFYLKAKAM